MSEAKPMAALKAIKFIPCPRNFQVFPARRSLTLFAIPMRLTENIRQYFFWTLNALLGVAFIMELCVPNWLSWIDAATIALAAIASIAALNRQLPLQNDLPAALITAASVD